MQAELTQTPFDMPVAESEIVAGYQVEYTGFRFLLFFIGEFGTAFAFAAIASVLFLGGWWVPGFDPTDDILNVLGPAVLFGKVMFVGLPHLLGPVHLPPVPGGPAPGLRLEGADPDLAWSTSWPPPS